MRVWRGGDGEKDVREEGEPRNGLWWLKLWSTGSGEKIKETLFNTHNTAGTNIDVYIHV